MPLNPYLTFDGDCREAFEFYRSVFGGEFRDFVTFAEGPPEMEVAEADKQKMMHVCLPVGESLLMGSDTDSSSPPLAIGDNFSIAITGDSRDHCDLLFAGLSAGGTVAMPLQETHWGSYFGMCRDKFGIQWMLDYSLS